MISESGFAALSSSIEDSASINIQKIIVASSFVHRQHSMFRFLHRYEFSAILKNKCIRLEIA